MSTFQLILLSENMIDQVNSSNWYYGGRKYVTLCQTFQIICCQKISHIMPILPNDISSENMICCVNSFTWYHGGRKYLCRVSQLILRWQKICYIMSTLPIDTRWQKIWYTISALSINNMVAENVTVCQLFEFSKKNMLHNVNISNTQLDKN